jgi:hypothetical protein
MARKKGAKEKVRWIAADDEIFATCTDSVLGSMFLRGFAEYPDGSFKFLRRGSPEESRAKEALIQTLYADVLPYSESVSSALSSHQKSRLGEVTLLLQELARLFSERENPFAGGQRKLVLHERGNKRQPHRARDRCVAEFIAQQLRAGRDMESTVARARELYGGSRDYIFRVWKKRGEDAKKYLAAESWPADRPW